MNITLSHTDLQTIQLTLIAVALPFVAFLLNYFAICRSRLAGWVSTLAIVAGLVLSIVVFNRVWDRSGAVLRAQVLWFTIGSTKVYAGILLNNLSVLMLLLVTLIATPVHLYSMSYMRNDDRYERYFTWLSFFCFSMLALVVVDNLALLYACWELVGFSSYLLIGFWYTRRKAVLANKKAFIMNRIGDVGLIVAIMMLFTTYHTFDLEALFGQGMLVKSAVQMHLQYIAFIGIFLAVAAKSAQFPLHTWLPDAMEGPTSVSALIHAATMVAAGVFLLGRTYPMFNVTELNVLAISGCFTAFMAATIALTQTDLKRILAYSTISQLGYMVMAMGIGAYGSALFHLVTHAFFKCLLFLVAGLVIHEMQHLTNDNKLRVEPQNILFMGGLRKHMPFTFIVAVIAGLALVGMPFTSGYLSKDGILIKSFGWAEHNGPAAWLLPITAVLTSLMTAFYVTRLIVKVFLGDMRLLQFEPNLKTHFHDGNAYTKTAMAFLAFCCLFVVFSFNPLSYENSWVIRGFRLFGAAAAEGGSIFDIVVPIVVTLLNLVLIYIAYQMYQKQKVWKRPQNDFLFDFSYRQWYFNEIYNTIFVKPVIALSHSLYWFDRVIIDGLIHLLQNIGLIVGKISAWLDRYIVDGFLHLMVGLVAAIGNFFRRFQGGKVQYYLLTMLGLLLAVFIIKSLI